MQFNEMPYARPDLETLKIEFMGHVTDLKEASNAKEALAAVKAIQAVQCKIDTAGTLVSIRNSMNTQDDFYSQEMDFWDENGPVIQEWVTDYYKVILASPFRKDLEQDIPHTFFKMAENSLKTFDASVIPLLQKENKLVSEYNKLIAGAQLEFKGQTYNLAGLDQFAESTDRQERKEAMAVKYAFFAEHLEELDRIYDEMVKTRHQLATALGFKDYVEMGYARLNRLDYNREDVEVYRKEVLKHVVPVVQSIFERQQKRIGLNELKYYDLGLAFPNGNAKPYGTPEEIMANANKMYHELSPETGAYFDFMMDHDLFDLLTKPGKQAGAYCTYIPGHKAPFIFANFNGTAADVEVMTHEAGHGYQVYESRWIETPEAVWPTYESCEIHSMSMEFLTWPWMDLFFKEKTPKYKFNHLAGTVKFLPYGVLVDHFQHVVYENPQMTPAERRQAWRELEKQYNPWKDYDGVEVLEQGGFWMRQGHIFWTPFYYIDYTLAQVCAFQFWKRTQVDKDETALADYIAISKVGGSQSFLEIIETGHLNSPFKEGTLVELVAAIKAYLDQITEASLEV